MGRIDGREMAGVVMVVLVCVCVCEGGWGETPTLCICYQGLGRLANSQEKLPMAQKH